MKKNPEVTMKEILAVLAGEGLAGIRTGLEWFYRNWTNDPNFDLVEAVHRTRESQQRRLSRRGT